MRIDAVTSQIPLHSPAPSAAAQNAAKAGKHADAVPQNVHEDVLLLGEVPDKYHEDIVELGEFHEKNARHDAIVRGDLRRNFLEDGRVDFIGRFTRSIVDFDLFGFVDGKGGSKTDSFYMALPIQKAFAGRWDLKINPRVLQLEPPGSW